MYDLHMTVERYTAAEMPESENKFIRKKMDYLPKDPTIK
jgi:hypothetical protein